MASIRCDLCLSQPVASSTHVLVLFGDVFVCRQSNWQQIA